MIKKNIFCIVLMFLITECADYKPLYTADKSPSGVLNAQEAFATVLDQ